ncbi:MAG: protein-disulfide reductase DsbD family protein [Allosphingosinicella sp.]|uniref:protein-disulfide reductase DsbD family protein n=1 Tax=Allosphingosinicella sp. TaxID=2823234 RepID=UPI0039527859
MAALLRVLTAFALAFGLAAGGWAQAPGGNNIAASLVAESDRPAPGRTVTLAIEMRPKAGWHGYWRNPGDAGVEPRIEWRLPAGLEAGPLLYPVPERLSIAGLMNYVFKGDYAQLVALRVPDGLAPGTALPLRARFDYLACTDEICVPESADLALDLVVGDGGVAPARRAAFDRWRERLPRPLGGEARFAVADGRFRLAVPLPEGVALSDPYFYPAQDGAIAYAAPQAVSRNGDMLIVETDAGRAPPEALEGVLRIGEGRGLAFAAVPGDVPAAGRPVAGSGEGAGIGTLLAALIGALLGGLILNIMPCVFPILSLKALSLARAGGDEARARREALAYAAGVIGMCLALGGALLALRAAGLAAGWAFQLQDARVILFLLLLVTAIALGLAGLFRLPALAVGDGLARGGGARGAFWTGALAAFVATPCTGPFMGAALGAALVLPGAAALAVFGGLGLGLALPFLLLGFVPALRRRLPKPGPWMEGFQRLLSVPMFLTALGLAWILGRQAGADGMALGLGAALILGLALWWWGRRGGWLPLAPAAAALAAGLMLVPAAAPVAARAPGLLAEEAFSEARLAALRAEGRPVFVYFTADWCLSCKVNEAAVLERREVADAFAAAGVAVLVGDWTRGDPDIGRFLERHGRSGVPLYLFYRPGAEPEILPQVLTVGQVTGLVSRAVRS